MASSVIVHTDKSLDQKEVFLKEVGKFLSSNKTEFSKFVEANKSKIMTAMNDHKKDQCLETFRLWSKKLVTKTGTPSRSYKKQSAAVKSIPIETRKHFLKCIGSFFKAHLKKFSKGVVSVSEDKNENEKKKKKPTATRSYKKQSAALKSIPIEIRKDFIKCAGILFKSHIKKIAEEARNQGMVVDSSPDKKKTTKKTRGNKASQSKLAKLDILQEKLDVNQAKLDAKRAKLEADKLAITNKVALDEAKKQARKEARKRAKLDKVVPVVENKTEEEAKSAEVEEVEAVVEMEKEERLKENKNDEEEDMEQKEKEARKKAKQEKKAKKAAKEAKKLANDLSIQVVVAE